MPRPSTTGGVTPHGERIQIRFSYRGQDLRPTLPWRPTAANMNAARKLRRHARVSRRAWP